MVDAGIFFIIVTLAALVYSFGIRALQYKIGNQKEMEELQKETKRINEDYKKAMEQDNKARAEEIMKQQTAQLSKMGGLMMGQFKVMAVILVIFFGTMWVIGTIDPNPQDDITVPLVDDGTGCDVLADDLVYTGCYEVGGTNYGLWVLTVNAYNDNLFAKNTASFVYKQGSPVGAFSEKTGEISVSLNKEVYQPGETITIKATPDRKASHAEAVLNSGTWFYVDLPFTIPILNVQRIHQPYWWFIFVSLISGLIITPVYKRIRGGLNDKNQG